MIDIYKEIKKSFPDTNKITIEFGVIDSNERLKNFGIELADKNWSQLLRWERDGLSATYYLSKTCKHILSKLEVGSRVKFFIRDIRGNILDTMNGTVQECFVYFISGDACIKVDFGEGPSMYNILSLNFEEGGDK